MLSLKTLTLLDKKKDDDCYLQSYSFDRKNEARGQNERVDTNFERKMKHILLFLGSFLEKTWKVDSAFRFFDLNFIKSFT